MRRLSGMARNITSELLQLRQRDQDVHRVLKVALQPWPTLAGMKALIEFGVNNNLFDSYFRADYFCRYYHEDDVYRHKLRKTTIDRAESEGSESNVPIVKMDKFFYEKRIPRTLANMNYRLVSGSSSSLSRTALDSLPSSSSEGVVLRSRFSVMGSEAGYSETVDGDHSDFGFAFGVYHQ